MLKNYLVSAVLLLGSACAQVIDVHAFREIHNHVDEDTLVLLDIDDTLLLPVQMLGSDEWFLMRIRHHMDAGLGKHAAQERTLAEWHAIRFLTDMRLVEPDAAEIVSELQQLGCPVMGLTTQHFTMAVCTPHQLEKHGINLTLAAPGDKDHYFTVDDYGVLYRKGILFTSGKPKGKALMELLQAMDHAPRRVVFINDKASHLLDVEEELEKHGIEFVGLRYAYADLHKAQFDPEIATYQLHNSSFTKLLSDEEVELLKR